MRPRVRLYQIVRSYHVDLPAPAFSSHHAHSYVSRLVLCGEHHSYAVDDFLMARSVRDIVSVKQHDCLTAGIAGVIAYPVDQLVSCGPHVAGRQILKIPVREYEIVAVYKDQDRSVVRFFSLFLVTGLYLLIARLVAGGFFI